MSELPSTEPTELLAAAIAAVHAAIFDAWNEGGADAVSNGLTAAVLVLDAVLEGIQDERLTIEPLADGESLWIDGRTTG